MIFISHRREDATSLAAVRQLRSALEERYGKDSVFVDHHSIQTGDKWPDRIERELATATVFLAVVGPGWNVSFTSGTESGRPRLDDPNDWVRREICTVLSRGESNVIVVFVDGGHLPQTKWRCELDELPDLQHEELLTAKEPARSQSVAKAIRDRISAIGIATQEVKVPPTNEVFAEAVLNDAGQAFLRTYLASLNDGEVDEAIRALLPDRTTPALQARARAAFALQCLSEGNVVSDQTAAAVCNAAISQLQEKDGVSIPLTAMDFAFAALSQTSVGVAARLQLSNAYIE
ncbi:MAG TPA: toll/interleukin-1 receptor domain-containing protein, partial [Myxococcales bacterium]|nr:toll/interleukin-1 receptor domain-containing protein [Myxococcales bacterium]